MKDARLKSGNLQSVNDSGGLRQGTAAWLGRDGQPVQLASLYGLVHNPPLGSQVLLLPQSGQESNSIGLPDHPAIRPLKNLKPGEVAVVNYLTGAYIIFKENNDIELFTDGNVIGDFGGDVTATIGGNVAATIGGDLTATVSGNVTETVSGNLVATVTGNLTMTAAQISLNGVIIDTSGNITTPGTVTADDFIET